MDDKPYAFQSTFILELVDQNGRANLSGACPVRPRRKFHPDYGYPRAAASTHVTLWNNIRSQVSALLDIFILSYDATVGAYQLDCPREKLRQSAIVDFEATMKKAVLSGHGLYGFICTMMGLIGFLVTINEIQYRRRPDLSFLATGDDVKQRVVGGNDKQFMVRIINVENACMIMMIRTWSVNCPPKAVLLYDWYKKWDVDRLSRLFPTKKRLFRLNQ